MAMTDGVEQGEADTVAIEVKSVGVRWFHPIGFCIDRPNGHPDYTFVQWLTPTYVSAGSPDSLERPGGCIVYSPGSRQWYSGDAFTPFGNNWFHFNGVDIPKVFEEYGIPLDCPFHLRDDSFIESILQLLLWESMGKRMGWRRVLSAHASLFFVEAGRALMHDGSRYRSARNMELHSKFEDFREKLKAECTEPWTLALMAEKLHLSVSQFSKLYREFFAAKPVDDLIGMRIAMAEYYLRTTSIPISQIASMSGFTDIYYFSRVFKAKTGRTATMYRNQYHSESEL